MADVNEGESGSQVVEEARSPRPGRPRWVKVSFMLVAAVVVLLVVAIGVGVGGEHGPGRHGGDGPRTSAVHEDGGHRPPVDHGP